MIKKISHLISVVLVMFCASGCATVMTSKDFKERQKDIHSIAILPVDAQAMEMTFNSGTKPLPQIAQSMAQGAQVQAAQTLFEKGYQTSMVSESEMQSDASLKAAYYEIQALFEKATKGFFSVKGTVGSAANLFADKKNADALLLIREVAVGKSQGELTAEYTQSILATVATLGHYTPKVVTSQVKVEAALFDANLGDVLWLNTNDNQNVNINNPLTAPSMTASVLRPFPQSEGTKPLITPKGQPQIAPAILNPPPIPQPVITPQGTSAPVVSLPPAPPPASLNVALSPATNKALAGPSMNVPIPVSSTTSTKPAMDVATKAKKLYALETSYKEGRISKGEYEKAKEELK